MAPPPSHPSPNPTEPFQISVRVYYEDTDAVGIVYHANYIKFAERARTEYLRASGWDHQKVGKELGIAFVIRNMEISFHAPARIDDLLTASAEVMNCGTTSFTMEQRICRGEKLLAKLEVVVVSVTLEGKATRLPPQLRQIFEDKSPRKQISK